MTRRNQLFGCAMSIAAGTRSPASTLYLAQRHDGAPPPTTDCSTRHWLDPFARAKSNLSLKTRPFQQRASEQHHRFNPLRVDLTTEAGGTLRQPPPTRKQGAPTRPHHGQVNPFVSTNPENAARYPEKHLDDVIQRKKNKYRGSFMATYSPFLSLCQRMMRLGQTCMAS